MKKLILLLGILLLQTQVFSAENQNTIIFATPNMGYSALNNLEIQIQPPLIPTEVRVWIRDAERRNQIVWRGKLTAQNNYTLTPSVSNLRIGQYSVEAVYFFQDKEFKGKVSFWVD